MREHTAPFRILTVCTGNICRSPAVERVLAARLGPGVSVTSAGTHAVVGAPVSAAMVPLLTAAGGTADGFAARQLTPAMLREADLVLALTREHRATIVETFPAALRHTFTLREFARLVALVGERPPGGPAARLAALVPLARACRSHPGARPDDPAEDDVIDPYGGGAAVYRQSFAAMAPAIDTIATAALGRSS